MALLTNGSSQVSANGSITVQYSSNSTVERRPTSTLPESGQLQECNYINIDITIYIAVAVCIAHASYTVYTM